MNTAVLRGSPCGKLVPTDEGQWAFVPDPLPRRVNLSSSLVYRLDQASRAIATLAGIGETLPNPYLLIRPFLRREAVLSSRIEGTQASISDVFRFEASGARRETGDVREVMNYVRAAERGQALLKELPICVRLVNQVHAHLLEGVRGSETRPGELRARQVWIAPRGTPIHEARFIPPPASSIRDLLQDWEQFINEEDLEMPPLIQCALMHYQFEAIHPYLDGNGRIGRLLTLLFLQAKEVLPTPLLYLSAYFERNREDYYDHLLSVSVTGNWEPWLQFFLEGVAQEAQDALLRSRRVRQLQEKYRRSLQERHESGNGFRLLDEFFAIPFMTVSRAASLLDISYAGARGVLDRLARAEIVDVVSGGRPRLYVARELLRVLEAPLAEL